LVSAHNPREYRNSVQQAFGRDHTNEQGDERVMAITVPEGVA